MPFSNLFWRTVDIVRATRTYTDEDGLHVGDVEVASAVPCDIQLRAVATASAKDFPVPTNTDAPVNTWNVFCDLPLGTVRKGDKITDDLGQTYQVDAAWHNGFLYELVAREFHP